MKWILIIAMVLSSADVLAQTTQQTFEDANGRNVGRATTNSRGNTTFYDERGRNTGRSTTDSQGNTTLYDNMGRRSGSIRKGR